MYMEKLTYTFLSELFLQVAQAGKQIYLPWF